MMKEDPALLSQFDDIQVYINHEKYDKAEGLLLPIYESNPDSYKVLDLMAKLSFAKRDFQSAIKYGIRSTEIDALSFDAYFQLGCSLNMNAWYDQAVIAFQRAIEIEPGISKTFVELAKSYECLNQKDEALAVYGRAVFLLQEEMTQKSKNLDDFYAFSPLVINGFQFTRFISKGDNRNLHFESRDPLRGKYIRIIIFEEDGKDDIVSESVYGELEKGLITYERLHDSLSDKLRANLELSKAESFSYILYNLEES